MSNTSKTDNTEKVDHPVCVYAPSEDYWDQYGYNPPTLWDWSKRLAPDIYSIWSWDSNYGRLDDVVDVATSSYKWVNKAANGVDCVRNRFDRLINNNDAMISVNRYVNYGKRRIKHSAQALTRNIVPAKLNFSASRMSSTSLRALNYGTKALKVGGRVMPLVSLGFGVSYACDRFSRGQIEESAEELISGVASFVPIAGPIVSTAIDIDLLLYDTHKFHFGNYVKLPNMLLSPNEVTQLWDWITTGENATTRYERECKEKGIEPTKEGAMMFAVKEEIKENIKEEAAYQGISYEEAIEIYKAQQEVIKQYGGTWNYVWETSIKPGLIEAGEASYAMSQALWGNFGAIANYCNKKIEDEVARQNALNKEVCKHYNTIKESLISQGVPPEEAKKFVKLLIEHEKLVLAGKPTEKAEQLILDQMDKISQKNKYSNNTNSNKINLNTYWTSGVSLGAMNAANGSSLGFNAAEKNSHLASNQYENLAGELKEQTGDEPGYYAVARSQDMRIDKRLEMRENETYQFHQESILLKGQKDSRIDNRIDRNTINNSQEILTRRQVETVR